MLLGLQRLWHCLLHSVVDSVCQFAKLAHMWKWNNWAPGVFMFHHRRVVAVQLHFIFLICASFVVHILTIVDFFFSLANETIQSTWKNSISVFFLCFISFVYAFKWVYCLEYLVSNYLKQLYLINCSYSTIFFFFCETIKQNQCFQFLFFFHFFFSVISIGRVLF